MAIAGLRNDNNELAIALGQRDQEIAILREQLDKTKKGGSKESAKLKKTSKDLQREITKLKTELDIQRTQND